MGGWVGGWRCTGHGWKREEHRIVSGERSPRARGATYSPPYTDGAARRGGLQRASGRSDVPNEYQQESAASSFYSRFLSLSLSLSLSPPPLFLSLSYMRGNEFYFRGRGARADTNDCSDSVFPARRTASCCSEPRLWPIEVARGEEDAVVENFLVETWDIAYVIILLISSIE